MTTKQTAAPRRGEVLARVGDTLEASSIHGGPPRRGEVLKVLGRPGHEHYLVLWDEQHESIVYPADGVRLASR